MNVYNTCYIQEIPMQVAYIQIHTYLRITHAPHAQASDFAAAHALVWDQALSDAEMVQVSSALVGSLTNSSIRVDTLGSPSTCNCSVTWPACGGVSSTATQYACPFCTKCKAGAFLAPACNGSCLECPYGTFSVSPAGASSCTRCPAGTYSRVPGATGCLLCPPGTYSPPMGMTYCISVSACVWMEIAGTLLVTRGAELTWLA